MGGLLTLAFVSLAHTLSSRQIWAPRSTAQEALREFVDLLPQNQTYRNWVNTTPPCEWDGLFCDSAAHVLGIFIKDFPGAGTLRHEWVRLPRLRKFSIVRAPSLTLALPPVLPQSLEFLEIQGCQVGSSIPTHYFANNTVLTHLIIENTTLCGRIPPRLPPQLVVLKLRLNHLVGPAPQATGSALQKLYLSHNQLSGRIDFDHLLRVPDLRLDGNYLSGFLTDRVLANKTTVHLQNNCFRGPVSLRNTSITCNLLETCVDARNTTCEWSARRVCNDACSFCGDGHFDPETEQCDSIKDAHCSDTCTCENGTAPVSGICVKSRQRRGYSLVDELSQPTKANALTIVTFSGMLCFVLVMSGKYAQRFKRRREYEHLEGGEEYKKYKKYEAEYPETIDDYLPPLGAVAREDDVWNDIRA